MTAPADAAPHAALPPFKTGAARKVTGWVQPHPACTPIPFAIIEGAKPGSCLLVTAGTHVTEKAGIEAARRLIEMPPDDLTGTLVVLPVLNMKGLKPASDWMPEDGTDLRAIFPGRTDGTAGERLAAWLVGEVFLQIDAYMELRGAGFRKEVAIASVVPDRHLLSLQLAVAYGTGRIWEVDTLGPTPIASAARLDKAAIAVEVGDSKQDGTLEVAHISSGIARVMGHLRMRPQGTAGAGAASMQKGELQTVFAPQDGFWVPAAQLYGTVGNTDEIGKIHDFFGNQLETVLTQFDGEVVLRASKGWVTKGDALIGIVDFHAFEQPPAQQPSQK